MTKRAQPIVALSLALSLTLASSTFATDGIGRLISVTQLKAENAKDPPPPPSQPRTIVGNFWEGTFQSDRNGYSSGIRIDVNDQWQSYIEQDNLIATVIHCSIDFNGRLQLIGYDFYEDVFVRIDAQPLAWSPQGEATRMVGEYQTYRLDSIGRKRVLDQGSLGIIAILIGL